MTSLARPAPSSVSPRQRADHADRVARSCGTARSRHSTKSARSSSTPSPRRAGLGRARAGAVLARRRSRRRQPDDDPAAAAEAQRARRRQMGPDAGATPTIPTRLDIYAQMIDALVAEYAVKRRLMLSVLPRAVAVAVQRRIRPSRRIAASRAARSSAFPIATSSICG